MSGFDAAFVEEVNLARLSYLQEFGSLEVNDSDDEIEDHFASTRDLLAHGISHSGNTFSTDLGVSEEIGLSTEELMARLGLRGKPSLPFMNLQRHIRPYLVWTAGLPPSKVHQMICNAKAPDYIPLSLRWHQLAGVASLVRLLSSTQRGGVLIADDTGIGKTSQSFGFLAMMMHHAEIHNLSGAHGKLAGLPVSTGPHVIVAPNSLIDNWRAEGMMWLDISVAFFVYEGSLDVRKQLLGLGSRFEKSKFKAYKKIILVPSSVSWIAFIGWNLLTITRLW